MTTAQTALRLGRSVRTVHRMVQAGRLKATRVPGYKSPLLFDPAEVEHVKAELCDAETGQLPLRGLPEGSRPVDPAVGRASYRIVQEALTNASKHAPVTVMLDQLEVRVVNGASARTPVQPPGGGFELVGWGERVRTRGGRRQAEARLDGGFAVEAVLPT